MDYTHRAEKEKRLARLIAGLGSRQKRELLKIMGDPPKMENVDAQYWNGALSEWRGLMTPELEEIFVDSAVSMMGEWPGLGVDWGLVNEDAVRWSQQYGYDLVTGINSTTQRGLRQTMAQSFETPMTQAQLSKKLSRWYGPVRAEMIAVTETTRAAVEGERAAIKELAAQGIEMTEIWETAQDEIVYQCPICWPKQGIAKGVGTGAAYWDESMGPPAHPRCRCNVRHELIMPEDNE